SASDNLPAALTSASSVSAGRSCGAGAFISGLALPSLEWVTSAVRSVEAPLFVRKRGRQSARGTAAGDCRPSRAHRLRLYAAVHISAHSRRPYLSFRPV